MLKLQTMAAKRNKSLLVYLANAAADKVKKLLGILNRDERKAIKEVALNLIKGNIPLADDVLQNLKKYKRYIRELAKRGINKCKSSKSKLCKAVRFMLQATLSAVQTL